MRYRAAFVLSLLLGSALLLLVAGCNPGKDGSRIGDEFIEFYKAHGGERVFGRPLTEPQREEGLRVQYFENTRLEYHPDAPPGWRVRLTPLLVLRGRDPDPPVSPPTDPDPLTAYYPTTGHIVTEPFLSEYNGYGGPSVFGYPLIEAINEDGRLLQYFERAVFYWDPDAPPGQRVKLAPLGRMTLEPETSWWGDVGHVFPEGRVGGVFREFFDAYGGEAVFGPPLANAELDEDGHMTQVFERVRMEMYGPAEQPMVRLTPLGAWLAPPPGAISAPPGPGDRCFSEIGYCLAADFLAFFDAHGGRAVFGVPRSPLLFLEDGLTVQYLDSARFEWDVQTGQVRLSPLGRWLREGKIAHPDSP